MLVHELLEGQYYDDQISRYTDIRDRLMQQIKNLNNSDEDTYDHERWRELNRELNLARASLTRWKKKAGTYVAKPIKKDTGESPGYARFPKNVPYTNHHPDQRPSDDYDRTNNEYSADAGDEYDFDPEQYDDQSVAVGMDELRKHLDQKGMDGIKYQGKQAEKNFWNKYHNRNK